MIKTHSMNGNCIYYFSSIKKIKYIARNIKILLKWLLLLFIRGCISGTCCHGKMYLTHIYTWTEWGISRLNSCRFTSFALPHEILSFAGKYFSILQPRKGVNMYAYSILCYLCHERSGHRLPQSISPSQNIKLVSKRQ